MSDGSAGSRPWRRWRLALGGLALLGMVGASQWVGPLAPAVLEKLLIERVAPVVSVKDMAAAAELLWTEQAGAVFSLQ